MDNIEIKRRVRTAKATKENDKSFISSLEGSSEPVTGDVLFKAFYEAGLAEKEKKAKGKNKK